MTNNIENLSDNELNEIKKLNDRITQLEQENDAMRADLLLWENGGPLP